MNKKIIVVGDYEKDDYGNLLVYDKNAPDDKPIKITKKRPEEMHQLFIDNPSRAIELTWAIYTKGEDKFPYVASAKLYEGEPPIEPEQPSGYEDEPSKEELGKVSPPVPKQISGQETGMWWKEMGENLRSGEIDKNTPVGKMLRKVYYAQMFSVLGINIEQSKEKGD